MQRRTRIYYFIFFVLLTYSICPAQTTLLKQVKIDSAGLGLYHVIHQIEEQTGLQFHFSSIIEPTNIKKNARGIYTVQQVLDSILMLRGVTYIELDSSIVISPSRKSQENYNTLKGRVFNKNGKKQLPYASVYIKNTSLGTITNFEGEFKISIPDTLWGDTLYISAMGYETTPYTLNDYGNGLLEAYLNVLRIPIKNVLIRPVEPEKLIREAYLNRRKNYSSDDIYMYGFFRESNKQNDDYIALNEAVVEILKRPHSSLLNDLVRVEKGRKGVNAVESRFLNLVVKGGLYNSIRLDVIKYNVPFFSYYAGEEYKFWFDKSIIYRKRSTYVIGFNSKFESDFAGFRGKIYIDIESLAITRVEFELNPEGIRYAKSLLIQKVPRGYKASLLYAQYEVDYRFYQEKWHLSHVKSEVKIKVKKKQRDNEPDFSCDFLSTTEFVMTGISQRPAIKLTNYNTTNQSDIFVKQIEQLEENYWEGNNIIVPNESLNKTLKYLKLEGIIGAEHNFIPIDNDKSYLN